MSLDKTVLGQDTQFGFIDKSVNSAQLLNPILISNEPPETMLQALKMELRHASEFTFSVAFISSRGVALLKQALLDFQGTGRIITSRYLDFNDPTMFRELLLLDNVEVLVHQDDGFHSKGYVFHHHMGITAIVGSSNLTDNALLINREWNLKFSSSSEGDVAYQLDSAIRTQRNRSIPLSKEWIEEYEKVRNVPQRLVTRDFPLEAESSPSVILPNKMQEEALDALLELTERGEKRGVIISATGTGKTILAALATRMLQPSRILFIVHREQILDKARSEFQKVLDASLSDFGRVSGSSKELDSRFVFATIQSMTQNSTLTKVDSDAFDLIIIDEVHRAGADSYRKLINYFSPKFLLGLTATPERTDGFNIFELFDFNVPYEIRLQAALESNMLAPFHYYGVTDFTKDDSEAIGDISQLRSLVSNERVFHILQALRSYGHPENVRGLIFCSKKEEAYDLSAQLNDSSLFGKKLRTKALTGDDSILHREESVALLERGELDYLLTVDIFNEGIDIPSINQIVMLRGTQSSIIFTQQLGRGLRKSPGKDHLRVIDFIGNYDNNYLIPIALFGDNSRNKDSIRRRLINNDTTGTVSGVSSVNFDKISQDRILESLEKAQLVGKKMFKEDILNLQNRLNHLPALLDFARFNTVDPFILASKYDSYWSLLKALKFVDLAPTTIEEGFLNFLTAELLNGKRPHELLLLRELLRGNQITNAQFQELLESESTSFDPATISSVERVLTHEFYNSAQRKRFGEHPILEVKGINYVLNQEFHNAFFDSPTAKNAQDARQNFRSHVIDIVETGLYISRHFGFWSGDLVVGSRYSRKDVCRMLNWEHNNDSTIYGYKVDKFTATCPIFVTYDKADDVSSTTDYGDEFKDPGTLHWYSRSNRTLESNEVKAIVSNSVPVFIFVKKDDAEGTDFFYLGQAHSENSQEETMPAKDGRVVPVVTMDLHLESPIEQGLYDYISSNLDK